MSNVVKIKLCIKYITKVLRPKYSIKFQREIFFTDEQKG